MKIRLKLEFYFYFLLLLETFFSYRTSHIYKNITTTVYILLTAIFNQSSEPTTHTYTDFFLSFSLFLFAKLNEMKLLLLLNTVVAKYFWQTNFFFFYIFDEFLGKKWLTNFILTELTIKGLNYNLNNFQKKNFLI